MALPLLVSVHRDSDGGGRVLAGRVGVRPEHGRLDPLQFGEVVQCAAAAVSVEAMPVLMIPGEDAAVTAGEDAAGRALSALLWATPELTQVVVSAAGAASATGQPLVVVVDLHDPELRGLPWECLAMDSSAVPLESAGEGLVARLGTRGRACSGRRLTPVLWAADGEDPGVARLTRAVTATCASHGLDLISADAGAPAPDDAALVFLIGHGEAVDNDLAVLGETGALAPGTVAHALQPWLAQAALVVVLVCEGGVRHPHAPDGLVDRLLATGAAAVIGSEVRLSEQAGAALVHGLVPALVSGRSLAESVAAGRREVRALAVPFPDSRWWRLALTVGHIDGLTWCAASDQVPEGWSPDAGAATALSRAAGLSQQRESGWLGVEHLALALLADGADGALRAVLARNREGVQRFLDGFDPSGTAVLPSPRLARVRDALPSDFSRAQLIAAVLDDIDPHVRSLLGLGHGSDDGRTLTEADLGALVDGALVDDQETLTARSLDGLLDDGATVDVSPAPLAPGGRWQQLEVLGGPEDGRRFALELGQIVGRAAPGGPADHPLYSRGGADRFLSRRHLRGDGDGAVVLMRSGHWFAGRRRPTGRLVLHGGDVLAITPLTWVVALASRPAAEATAAEATAAEATSAE